MYLIDGRAEFEIEQYVKEAHTFDDFSQKVHFFDHLGKTLTSDLPKEVNLVLISHRGLTQLGCSYVDRVWKKIILCNIIPHSFSQ